MAWIDLPICVWCMGGATGNTSSQTPGVSRSVEECRRVLGMVIDELTPV